jgi:DNA-binding CsgD family transcriptional regulator
MTDDMIASRLGLSRRTVRTHLERLFARHRVHSRAAAVAKWLRASSAQSVTTATDR